MKYTMPRFRIVLGEFECFCDEPWQACVLRDALTGYPQLGDIQIYDRKPPKCRQSDWNQQSAADAA